MTSLTPAEQLMADAAFAQSGRDAADFVFWPKPGPPTPLRSFRSSDEVLTIAVTHSGRDRLTVEREAREWAQRCGIPVPTVRAAAPDDRWMVADYVTAGTPEGSRYVLAALDVADEIASQTAPTLTRPAAEWKGSRRTLVNRLLRQARGGLSLRDLRDAKADLTTLTDMTVAHGDLYRRNVLADPTGGVRIIDWEFVGAAPRFTDHVRLWSTLRQPQDREMAWDRITAGLAAADRRHLAVVVRYLVLRLLGENLAAPPDQRDADDLAHARLMVAQLPRQLAELAVD